MGPLIILLTVGIIAASLAAMVWRNRSEPTRRDTAGDSIGDNATFYDSGVYNGGAEASAGHSDTHCSHGGADFSADCGSDGGGGGSGGD